MAGKMIRKSIVAPYIDGLLEEKRANGFSYETEELILTRFDKYCYENGLNTLNITKNFMSGWMEQRETESGFNQGKRISCVKQLLLYLASLGHQVYIPENFCHFEKPIPHIFSPEEIHDLFDVIDSYVPTGQALTRLANEYRLLFRWYCCCGLRNSEAAGIAKKNVDLQNGVLTILNSKGNKDRLVYLPEDLRESSAAYFEYLTKALGFSPYWFFPAKNPANPLQNGNVDFVFSRFWSKTKFANCSNKPTVHDFRFSFVVYRVNLWSQEGIDLNVMLPYLSSYLGHKNVHETLYYYYLIQDAYKTISQKDNYGNAVIPEVHPYE